VRGGDRLRLHVALLSSLRLRLHDGVVHLLLLLVRLR
jgi:hypothetical protein